MIRQPTLEAVSLIDNWRALVGLKMGFMPNLPQLPLFAPPVVVSQIRREGSERLPLQVFSLTKKPPHSAAWG